MRYTYRTWPGKYTGLSDLITEQTHVIIAGASGSGKSVLIRQCLIACAAKGYNVYLIDPKKVELYPWASTPICHGYADEADTILALLQGICANMDNDYRYMKSQGLRKLPTKTWIIIDEYADLMQSHCKREIKTCVMRIAQLGRAAGYHLMVATQRPTTDIIDGGIKVNITTRIALHCPTAQDSRNIINYNGAESLPVNGSCYFLNDSGKIDRYKVKYTDEQEEMQVIDFLNRSRKRKWF